jgi:hypothetical protein
MATKVKFKKNNNVVTIDLDKFPEELENSWCFIHDFKNNHNMYSYMFCLYNNDDFPKGTVIISPYFYHKYPDIYSLYSKPNEDKVMFATRVHVNPKHRGKQWMIWYAYITRDIFWNNFGFIADVTSDRNKKVESWYKRYTELSGQEMKTQNNGRMNYPSEEMPRDPAYPYIWYNNRISEKVKI